MLISSCSKATHTSFTLVGLLGFTQYPVVGNCIQSHANVSGFLFKTLILTHYIAR